MQTAGPTPIALDRANGSTIGSTTGCDRHMPIGVEAGVVAC
jgi:hypothetical protein